MGGRGRLGWSHAGQVLGTRFQSEAMIQMSEADSVASQTMEQSPGSREVRGGGGGGRRECPFKWPWSLSYP